MDHSSPLKECYTLILFTAFGVNRAFAVNQIKRKRAGEVTKFMFLTEHYLCSIYALPNLRVDVELWHHSVIIVSDILSSYPIMTPFCGLFIKVL